jgi:hypothetical protein
LCFGSCLRLSTLTFESGCQISILGDSAFADCLSVQSICIPASVEIISQYCFRWCEYLSELVFESGCRLSTLGESAFEECRSLQSIRVPAPVETISKYCFRWCEQLSELVFESGCRLSALDECAFEICRSLQSIGVPSSNTEACFPCPFGSWANLVNRILEAARDVSGEPLSEMRPKPRLTGFCGFASSDSESHSDSGYYSVMYSEEDRLDDAAAEGTAGAN